ncbi:MAG: type I methionyl aminopeptidase [Clostridiales bacterium]|nr:type I methionyl aminopeptidase [Clostridiales bacterium]
MIIMKSPDEIRLMAESGRVTARILRELADLIRPGITTAAIDEFVEKTILSEGMIPAFKGYSGYPASACVSVNEQVVHGIPGRRKLKEGDIVSVDVGTIYQGYYSDAARTYAVGAVSEDAAHLIRATEESFFEGLKYCRPGFRLSDVSSAIQRHAEAAGCSVVRDFVGHGIGRAMHEEPQIPNYGPPGRGPKLQPGMCLAIEPMINAGSWKVKVLEDDWTVVTVDGSLSAHYENTVVITEDEPLLLTI